MIATQESLFEMHQTFTPIREEWCADDWETPPEVARFMASLVQPHEQRICEPSAGTGNIARYLDDLTVCVEKNPIRCEAGRSQNPSKDWWNSDYLTFSELYIGYRFDLIVGNPPFSLACDFLQVSTRILSPEGRILFLLPSEFFQSQARAQALRDTGLVITHQWMIAGRVGYLKEGEVYNQRQCYDSVFELKLNAAPAVEIVDPYGKLRGAK